MVNLKETQHLFFDLDDTLWDFQKNSSKVITELFNEFDLTEKLNTNFETFHETYKKVNNQLWSKYYKKEIDKAFLRNHRFNEAFKMFGYDNYQENLSITEEYVNRSPKGTILKEGCIEVLTYLKQKYHLHIITNGFREVQFIKLKGSGIKDFFSQIIISEDHDLTKPDEKIFRLAEKFASTHREHCVMIGDKLESDISGANNAGWEAIYFTEKKDENYSGKQIESLMELKGLF